MFEMKDLNHTVVRAVYGRDFDKNQYTDKDGKVEIPADIIAKHTLRIQFDFSNVADIKTVVENSLKTTTTTFKAYYNNYLRDGEKGITEKQVAELYAKNPIKVDVQKDLYDSSRAGVSIETKLERQVAGELKKGKSPAELAEALRKQLAMLEGKK